MGRTVPVDFEVGAVVREETGPMATSRTAVGRTLEQRIRVARLELEADVAVAYALRRSEVPKATGTALLLRRVVRRQQFEVLSLP